MSQPENALLEQALQGLDQGSETEVIALCDRLEPPGHDDLHQQLLDRLHVALRRGLPASLERPRDPFRTAILRALQRLQRPTDGVRDEVITVALGARSSLVRGAALDVLDAPLHRDEALRQRLRSQAIASVEARNPGALRAVRELGPRLFTADAEAHPLVAALAALLSEVDLARPASEALEALGPPARPAIPVLLAALASHAPDDALAILRALLTLAPGADESAQAIELAVSRPEPELVRGALELCHELLGQGRLPVAHRALSPARLRALLTKDAALGLRVAACDLLGLLGTTDDVDALVVEMSTAHWPLRVAAHEAVASIDRRLELPLERLDRLVATSPNPARNLALHLLGERVERDPRARERLQHLCIHAHLDSVRTEALHALCLHPRDPSHAWLLPYLASDTAVALRRRALSALKALGPAPDHRPVLVERLRDPDASIRRNACLALGPSSSRQASLEVFLGLIRRLVDLDAAPQARKVLNELMPQAPAHHPVRRVEPPHQDWSALFQAQFCASPAPAPADWRALLEQRARWASRLLSRPPAPLPDDLCLAAHHLVELAQQHRLHRLASPRPDDRHGAEREIAWLLTHAWKEIPLGL